MTLMHNINHKIARKILLILVLFIGSSAHAATNLVSVFEQPSHQYKPWAFWYWINGNITKKGIHADLKSMAEAGLGGVLLMHINEHGMIPEGPVRFMSDEYKALMKYTIETAAEYDLQINLYNGEGWSVAGGPWITPELGMKEMTWSEINTTSRHQVIQFPKPHAPLDYYHDIATLAFPTPTGFIEPNFNQLVNQVEVSGNATLAHSKFVIDKDWNTQISPTKDPETGETYIKLDFEQSYTFSNAFIKFAAYGMMGRNYVMVSDDGVNYREVAFDKRGQIYDDIGCFQFDSVTTRHVKFVFKPTDNKLLYTAMPKVTVSVRDIELDNRPRVDLWCKKAAHAFPFFRDEAERTTFKKTIDKNNSIDFDSIIDVSEYLDVNGRLNWTPPKNHEAGDNWTIVRFGYSSTEAINRPGSEGGEGLEVDKMNVNALDAQFDGYIKKIKQLAGEHTGKALFSTHTDSWEVGRQNWTQDFPQAFEDKRGYSLIKFLPATLGYVIDQEDKTERFLWDMRKTIADLISERFYGGMRERANALGIKYSAQSMKPFIDNLHALGQADIVYANNNFRDINPIKNERNRKNSYMTAKMTASAGSIYDRMVSSESFTALPEANRWLNHPQYYKPNADSDFAAGVTQVTHHLFTHQPWTTVEPGMTLGYWGLHFERTQTWWHEIATWNQYLTRTSAMLRQGQPVFDVLHYLGDDSATRADKAFYKDEMLAGYDFEFISTHGLLNKLYVNNDKKLAYSSGRQYSILSVADDVSMRPIVLNKLKNLLKQGAIIVGHAPKQSPSLQGGKVGEQQLNRLIKDIWQGEYKDQVFNTLVDALNALEIQPDVQLVDADTEIMWRHHYVESEDKDFYFISNIEQKKSQFEAHFRVSNKVPELWNPLTGERKQISNYRERDGKTIIPLTLEGIESQFIVFTKKATTSQAVQSRSFKTVKTLKQPWQVNFVRGVHTPDSISLNKLIDLKDHSVADVQYFSGTARYQSSFDFQPSASKSYVLDLGKVHQFARVYLNGKDLGVQMWRPYQFDITADLLAGTNVLEVEVTNLWPNRLIGDERIYGDTADWKVNGYQGSQLVDFPKWLTGASPKQPGKRNTFTTWKHWSKDDALLPSGLIGPIKILQRSN